MAEIINWPIGMSTFIVCMMIYIHKFSGEIAAHAWVLRFPELTGGRECR